MRDTFLYGGISGVEMEPESFDLSHGVVVRRTYAHLMAPCIMAFARPELEGAHHPGPWKAAKGGFSFDVNIELRMPLDSPLGKDFTAKDSIWWVAAILRLAAVPPLSVTVLSDHPFDAIPALTSEPTLQPFETTGRIFAMTEGRKLEAEDLSWVKDKWLPSAELLKNKNFYAALKSFDFATMHGRTSGSLLALWGAIEALFSPARSELRFRVASLLASYLEPTGSPRRDAYKRILSLYDARSTAAHTAHEPDMGPIVETYVLARNALVRMVDESRIPTAADLENLLFGCD